jgi:hypothetical protein
MKKQVLISMLLATSTLALVSGTYASDSDVRKDPCALNGSGVANNPERCDLSGRKDVFHSGAQMRKEDNKELRATNSGAVHDFHNTHSGAVRDAVKSLSGAQRDALKDAKETQKDLRASMSGKTLEEKLALRDALEAAQAEKLKAKLANNPELLAARLAVYEQNKARRDTIVANRTKNLVDRSALTLESVKLLDTQVRANMANISSADQKAKLVKKIDEKITKINASNGITAASKTEMVTILTTLKADLLK